MQCKKCNNEYVEGCKYCPTCGTKIENVTNNNSESHDNSKPATLSLISIGLLFVTYLVIRVMRTQLSSPLVTLITSSLPLIGLVIMIYVRVKYPKNILGIIVMIIYILGLIAIMIYLSILAIMFEKGFISCIEAFVSCDR